jgi:amino acid transporter
MAAQATNRSAEPQSAHAMADERAKLKKVLRRFDLVCFTIAAFISIDTIAATAAYGGGETLFWILAVIVLYMIPSGLIAAELGSAFPVEGGPYAWTRMAFGRLPGSLTATFYWMSNPTWIGGTLAATTVATLSSGLMLNRTSGFSTFWSIVIGVVVVWAIVGLSMIEVKWGRWTGIIGTVVRVSLLAVFLALVVWFLIAHGKPTGTITWSDLKPSLTGFLAVVGLLQFLFVGFELSNSASEEMTNARHDIPAMIVRSGLSIALIVIAMIFGILLVVPSSGLSNVTGFIDAYNSVKTVLGSAGGPVGWLVGVLMILTIISCGGVWLQGSARTQAVAGLDGAAPLFLGKFSKSGTPLAMNISSGIIGSAFVVLVFTMTSGSLSSFFGVMLSIIISLTAMQYFFIMASVLTLRKKYPNHPRPYRIPGGTLGVWLAVLAAEFVIVLTTISLVWPGLLDNLFGRSYSIQDNWGTSRVFFESVTLGTLGVIVLMAVLFWLIGKHNLATGVVVDNDLLTLEAARGAAPSGVTAPGVASAVAEDV